MTPPSAIARPAAEACTAPHAPRARPDWPFGARFMVAVNVPCPNRPAPKPISSVPRPNSHGDISGADTITRQNAGTPTSAPKLAIRNGSAPRLRTRDASQNPNSPPTASAAVSFVVSPTARCRTCPP